MTPTLIGCSHGTSSQRGRDAIRSILDDVRALRPDLTVVDAFVDVQEPAIDDVVMRETAHGTAVVVPLLLSTGYHTRVDIARAVTASGGRATATLALGPHPLLADILTDRLAAVSLTPQDALVLAAAGSSDPQSAADVRATAALVSDRIAHTPHIGFAASATPTLVDAVASARDAVCHTGVDPASGSRVVAASYVLAPGFFASLIDRSGVDVASAPLAPDPRLAQIVLERFDNAAIPAATPSATITRA